MAFIRNNTPNNNGRRHNNNGGQQRPRYNSGGSSYNNQSTSNHTGQRKPSSRLNQVFDSNTPDARVRGTALQIVEKYQGLARDAHSSGDRVLAQSYQQHAEHYQRLHNEILEEHTAIEAERNAWRQSQQPQHTDQHDMSMDDMDQRTAYTAAPTDVPADMVAPVQQRPRQSSPPQPPMQPRGEDQPPRRRLPVQETIDPQELPSFLSIPIRAPQVAKPVSAKPAAVVEAPLVEAVVTRTRRRTPPVVIADE